MRTLSPTLPRNGEGEPADGVQDPLLPDGVPLKTLSVFLTFPRNGENPSGWLSLPIMGEGWGEGLLLFFCKVTDFLGSLKRNRYFCRKNGLKPRIRRIKRIFMSGWIHLIGVRGG